MQLADIGIGLLFCSNFGIAYEDSRTASPGGLIRRAAFQAAIEKSMPGSARDIEALG